MPYLPLKFLDRWCLQLKIKIISISISFIERRASIAGGDGISGDTGIPMTLPWRREGAHILSKTREVVVSTNGHFWPFCLFSCVGLVWLNVCLLPWCRNGAFGSAFCPILYCMLCCINYSLNNLTVTLLFTSWFFSAVLVSFDRCSPLFSYKQFVQGKLDKAFFICPFHYRWVRQPDPATSSE